MYEYVYASGKLLRQTYGNNTLDFFYDNSGLPFAMSYNGTMYYYITNLQGDVVMMVDSDGSEVARYTYDPYGKILTATGIMADINPLRYRGYYYDAETGMYYLQSRYYDPVVGRFINADAFVSTGQSFLGYNMFAYCGNNPVIRIDPAGESFAIVVGININLFGQGFLGTINFVSTEENFGVQCSYYLPDDIDISQRHNCTVGVDLGPYIGIQYTDKSNMNELEGLAKTTGGDLLLGGDILTDDSGQYLGWQFGASAYSVNMHSLYTNTITVCSIPTINVSKIIVDWILEEE